ncbi:MAG: glutamine--fructose-6-phosphate transaminase (isomerizing) [Opitutales bacterium]|jgi:glutamine---fructose-6-phosphate transaminase (isomerizing)
MCGIVGYLGKGVAQESLVDGLRRLEYRGYDSAGVAFHEGDQFSLSRETGRVNNLAEALRESSSTSSLGIAHTRWATHGEVTVSNTHPHLSYDKRFVLVHNGVIENFNTLKRFLINKGIESVSETDSEVLCNLIAYHYSELPEGDDRFIDAVRLALPQCRGAYGIAVLCVDYPDTMVGARRGSPLVVGLGEDANFIASDASAFVGRAKEAVFLNDGELAILKGNEFRITTMEGLEAKAVTHPVDQIAEEVELGDFDSYMEKEIFEQPTALKNTLRGRFGDDGTTAKLGGLEGHEDELRNLDRIIFVACGTARHACMVGEYLIERLARVPVEVEHASEFRYRNSPKSGKSLVIAVSQSGETLDTLEAVREAKTKGLLTLGITNVVGSSLARETDGGVYQRVGPEIGVASTKAFSSQVCLCAMLGLALGRMRDLSPTDGQGIVEALKGLPDLVEKVLQKGEEIRELAVKYSKAEHLLFLGRQSLYPVALEGALKLKEISYAHAEGYPAAELKHGPIALISPDCPSIFIIEGTGLSAKTIANMQEVKARKGPVIAIAPEGIEIPKEAADDVFRLPVAHEVIRPILANLPLQLFAYHFARLRGLDVDKPRNLAKSVTVE